MIIECLRKLVEKKDLTEIEAKNAMKEILDGNASNSQISSFLTALRIKGETIQEIKAFAQIMREASYKIHPEVDGRLVDTCGTGGDKIKTFNISTISAFIVAGSGIGVAKHGNRSVTSHSGSADVLEYLGLNLDAKPNNVERAIEIVGIGFMFAPLFHLAMKYAVKARREIGFRTVFNLLGPLTNPAGAEAQVIGVYAKQWLKPLAYVLKGLGLTEAMVVYGLNGMDEISTLGKTEIAWLKKGKVSVIKVDATDLGFRTARPRDILGATIEENAKIMFEILYHNSSYHNPRRDIVILNAAAGIIVGGKADDFRKGVEVATETLESGRPYDKLKMLIHASGGDESKLEELEKKT